MNMPQCTSFVLDPFKYGNSIYRRNPPTSFDSILPKTSTSKMDTGIGITKFKGAIPNEALQTNNVLLLGQNKCHWPRDGGLVVDCWSGFLCSPGLKN
jgi:hypothetical protein